jgi:hypothetical protein
VADTNENNSSVVALILAWLWVGIPLCWGIEQTIIKAMALFS